MRSHARAASAGSTERSGGKRRLGGLLAICALALCALGSSAPAASAATATIDPAPEGFNTTARVVGHIEDPVSQTYWRFDIKEAGTTKWTEGAAGVSAAPNPVPAGADRVVKATLTGLEPETEYVVRFGIYDEGAGDAVSAEPGPSFTTTSLAVTPTAPSVLVTDNASEVGITTAKASGEVQRGANADPLFDALCYFEYVSDDQFNANLGNGEPAFTGATQAGCEPENPVIAPGASKVEAILRNIASTTTYHLRLSVSNSAGADSKEAAATFTTQTATTVPTLAVDPAANVAFSKAQISGTINPEGGNSNPIGGPVPILWQLQYTRADEPGNWQLAQAGTLEGVQAESDSQVAVPASPSQLTGLAPATEYKVRLVASYAGKEAISPEGSFETNNDPITPPLVEVDNATLVTGTGAHFSGHITPGDTDPLFDATCKFEYITDAAFQARDEQQKLTVKATSGTFKLFYEGEETAPLPASSSAADVQGALEDLNAIGSGGVAVSGGPGDLGGTSLYTLTFSAFDAQQVAVDGGALTSPGTAKVTSLDGAGDRDEVQKLAFSFLRFGFEFVPLATGGSYTLTYEGQTTASLPFGSDAATVQSALEALPMIGAGNVAVSGSDPLSITFVGALAKTNVSAITVDQSALTLAGAAEAQTTTEGHAQGFDGAQAVDCDPNPVKGTDPSEPIAVKADAIDLEPGTVYHLRLWADNQGSDPVTDDAANFKTEALEPVIADTSVADVTTTSATLNAQINPRGDATTYHFEYLTLDAFLKAGESFVGATRTPESASVGADNQLHLATAAVTGLAPDTAYRFRVVADNSASASGGTPGPVRSFHTLAGPVSGDTCPNAAVRAQQTSASLPECRAYEIVSDPGLDLGETHRMPWASDDGNSVAYESLIPDNDALGGAVISTSVARRTPSGWRSESASGKTTNGVLGATGIADPRAFSPDMSRVLVSTSLPMSDADTNPFPDFYRVDVGLGSATWLSRDAPVPAARFVGTSVDLDKLVYTTATGDITGLFWTDGKTTVPLTLDSDYPDKISGAIAAQTAGSELERGLNVPSYDSTAPAVERRGNHAVSDDANRVYFLRWLSTERNIFLRDLGAQPAPKTVAVSVSERAEDAKTVYPGQFISASHDGAQAYFVSPARLTEASTPGGGIYSFDLEQPEGQRLEQITPDANDPAGPDVREAMSSDDQSHLYFTATAVLASGAQAGDNNAYVWTQAGGVRFIATTSNPDPFRRVTANGRYALLQTRTSIEGAPNNGHEAIYRYDYDADQIDCVSCRPDGSASEGDAAISGQSPGIPNAPFNRNRGLSADGRVMFMSTDPIVAGDQTSAMDVYLHHDEMTSLLSDGRSAAGSYVGDISDDGVNVSFTTRTALVGADHDSEEFDVYDARVGGGFFETPAAAPCEGEACRGGAPGPPPPVAPTTPNFIGPPDPHPCAKGKIRRNGRCVKQRKARKHQKKHAKKHKSNKRAANANGRTGR